MAVVDNSLRIFYSPQIVKGRDIDDLCHETGVEFIKLPDYSFKSGIEIVRSLNNIEARSYTNVAFATIPWARAFLRSKPPAPLPQTTPRTLRGPKGTSTTAPRITPPMGAL